MTTQIDGGFDENRSYPDTASYLGSIVGSTPTTDSDFLDTSIFPGFVQNYMTNDDTWITEILARFYQKMYFDKNATTLSTLDVQSAMINYLQSITSGSGATPSNLDSLALNFVTWSLDNLGYVSPALDTEKALMLDGSNSTDLRFALNLIISANLGAATGSFSNQLETAMSGLVSSDISPFTTVPQPSRINYIHDSINSTALGLANFTDSGSIIEAMVEKSIVGALKDLSTLTTPTGVEVIDRLNQYYTRFAAIANYFEVFQAFNLGATSGVGSPAQTALFNFIDTLANDPNGDGLNFSQDFGAWFTAVKENYIAGINGNPSLNQSMMGPSSAKVAIINRIYALIAAMIQIVQKTTAAQADQLKVLSVLQGEMTNLISAAPILTSSSDGELGDSDTDENQSTLRDELNSVITAWTDTIRAQRDFIKSQAQTQQTNVNNSNDAVNQQASMATALIQQQSTLLSAIYR